MAILRSLASILFVTALVAADVYMHNPRGSNNRMFRDRDNDPNNRQTENDERLFDSQDNNNGGYDWNGDMGKMEYYEGSVLNLEWTMQHGCGNDAAKCHCDVIWQYTCGAEVRDGTVTSTIGFDQNNPFQVQGQQFGRHESTEYYAKCFFRERNMGLFLADQDENINGDRAIYTRQQPNGNNNGNDHHGYECPEERDYYPYWHWTPWVDIAVLTTNTDNCDYYRENSQNTVPRGECVDPISAQETDKWYFNNEGDCVAGGGQWQVNSAWNVAPPECLEAPWTEQNNLGNARAGVTGGIEYDGTQNPMYPWTIPSVDQISTIFADQGGEAAAMNCVVRVRYNISTNDYDGWNTYAASNSFLYSDVINDPWGDYGGPYLLRMAIDTTQFGRTFQDRSHTFSIVRRPVSVESYTRLGGDVNLNVKRQTYTWQGPTQYFLTGNEQIHNLNTIGRRGNLIQAYPAEQYAFRPRVVRMRAGDFLHPQWTGTDYATRDAQGEGTTSQDRFGLVQIHSLKENYPVNISNGEQYLFEPNTAWALAFSGIYRPDGSVDTSRMNPAGVVGLCPSLRDLELQYSNDNAVDRREQIREDPFNCMKLSGTNTPHFDGGLIQMNNPGTYYAMDPRNNAPGMHSVKVTIVVEE